MTLSKYTIEDIIARHGRGEKVIITDAAAIPSDIFPIGSMQEFRVYAGRTATKWGTLAVTFKAEINKNGFTIPKLTFKNMIDIVTGKPKKERLSYWIVRPEGIEQFTGSHAEFVDEEPPSLDSLLTKTDYIT
jgi:hypothetical protein